MIKKVAALGLWGLALFGLSGCKNDAPKCKTDSDCAPDQVCVPNDGCKLPGTDMGTTEADLRMNGDLDMRGGSVDMSMAENLTVPKLRSAGIFGSAMDDEGTRVALDSAGNLFVSGRFSGILQMDPKESFSSAGATDAFVTKYNADGTYAWTKTFGGPTTDFPARVATAGTDVIVAGSYADANVKIGNDTLSSVGGYDGFVARFGSDGSARWVVPIRGNTNEVPLDVATDAAGNTWVAGGLQGGATLNISGTTLTSKTQSDFYLAKLSSDGRLLKLERYGQALFDFDNLSQPVALATDPEGNVYVTGQFQNEPGANRLSFGGATPLSATAAHDVFVAKLSGDLAHVWSLALGGSSEDVASGIAVDPVSRHVVVTGRFIGDAKYGPLAFSSSMSSRDIFVARLDDKGQPVWAERYGGTEDDRGVAVALDPYGNMVITGSMRQSAGFGGTPLNSNGLADVFVAKLAWDGAAAKVTHRWSMRFGANGDDVGTSVVADRNGRVWLTGFLTASNNQSIDFGEGQIKTAKGGRDIFLLRIGIPGFGGEVL